VAGLEPAPPAARKAGSLRCPYHSWTYRLDGELLRAPWTEDVDGFDPAAFGLHPVGWRPGAASCSCT
jgi:Rieske 2Fe-2S family protein